MFLQGVGTSLVIPFLPSVVRAEEEEAKCRYIQIISPYGTSSARSSAPAAYAPEKSMGSNTSTKGRPLRDIIDAHGKISDLYGPTWNGLAEDINVITNFHGYFRNNYHHATGVTTGGGVIRDDPRQAVFPYSVDWVLEQHVDSVGSSPPIRAAIGAGSHNYTNSHTFGGGTDLPALRTLAQLEARVVSSPPESNQARMRGDLLNAVYADYKSVWNSPRLGSTDKRRLDSYLTQINELKARAPVDNQCPMTDSGLIPEAQHSLIHRTALDWVVASLSCGLTQIISYVIPQGGDGIDGDLELHNAHHDSEDLASVHANWRSDLAAYAVAALQDAVNENGESLLKSSVFYLGHEYAGAGAEAHSLNYFSGVIAGGANGALQSGYYLDAGGAPIGRLLVTLFKAMGLSASQYEQGGEKGFGEYSPFRVTKGPLNSEQFDFFTSTNERRRGLPIVAGHDYLG